MGRGDIRRRFGCLLLAGIFLLGTAGCGTAKEPQEEEDKELVLTGEMVPTASFQEVKFNLGNLSKFVWQDDHLLYLESTWDKERQIAQTTLYQVNQDGTGTPEALYTGISEDYSILQFTVGREGSFYFLERKMEENGAASLYLRKLGSGLQEVYLQAVQGEEFGTLAQSYHSFSDMHVDSNGNLLLEGVNNRGYFFDTEGRYTGSDEVPAYQGQMIDAGSQGYFYVCQDGVTWGTQNFVFQKVDFAGGRLGAEESRDLSAAQKNGMENGTILSGYDLGILISMENGLWSYDYDTGECLELLDWQKMGVDGSILTEIRFLQPDFPLENLSGYAEPPAEGGLVPGTVPEIPPVLEAFSYDVSLSGGQNPEIVRVGYLDRGYVPEKQTVTLGMAYVSTPRMGQLVRSFNRSNMKYEVVIKNYDDMDTFTNDLLFNPSEVPDMLELGWVNKDMLEKKGLLEDLTPYFKESDVVGEADIMEAVWDSCGSEEGLYSMMTNFSLTSLYTTADTIPRSGWTYDQLFGLGKDYPDSKLLNVYSAGSVWNLLSNTMDSYIDWEKGECHFDSPEFKGLLENVKGLSYPENQEDQRVFYSDEEAAKLLKKEFLLQYIYYYSPYDYSQQYNEYKDKAWDVGFPTQDGELCYLMSPMLQFSICSASPCKDGAWAFLEFVLSEEQQSWYGSERGGFPVRKDAFEAYLRKPYNPLYHMEGEDTSEEMAERLRNVMEHLRLDSFTSTGEIDKIIHEEIQAFFAGDKTVEQCVEIIQNKAQLYLDVNY